MPSQGSFWLLTEPLSGTNDQSEELEHAIGADAGGSAKLGELAPFKFPEFKVSITDSFTSSGVPCEADARRRVPEREEQQAARTHG